MLQQQQHRRGRSLSSALANERDEDLTLFQEMQKSEREVRGSIFEEGGTQTPTSTHKSLGQSLHRFPSSTIPFKSNGVDDIFSLDREKNDYDWLMTPPGTPLLQTLDHDLVSNGSSLNSPSSIRPALKISKEPLPNLRTSMAKRSLPNSRGSSTRTTQAEPPPLAGARSRQQLSSPVVARGQISCGLQNGSKSMHRSGKVDDGTARIPAAKGINGMMWKKTVQMRKSIPFSEKEHGTVVVDSQVKRPMKSTPLCDAKSSITFVHGSSGFGRNLSKKSLDMALRHMDIHNSTPGGFRSSMSKNVSGSSVHSVRSGNNGALSTCSVTDSLMARSNNANLEHSTSVVIDPEGSELGDESVSKKDSRSSPANQHDLLLPASKERGINCWLAGPDYREDTVDIMQIFEQEGLESLSGPESPFASERDETIECVNFCLDLV